MKKLSILTLILCMLVSITGCSTQTTDSTQEEIAITDSLENTEYLSKDARVVSCFASFADMWLLSGGSLVGVTDDAISDRGLDVGDAEIIGTVKHIDLEKVVSLQPDYVILSADLTAHMSLKESLDSMNVPYGYFKEDTFDDYKVIMEQFCKINDREDLYEENVLNVEKEISNIKSQIPETDSTCLLIRAFSTGMKAKTDDNLAGQILKEFGLANIADNDKSMLEDLSLEHIVKSDPDYIFVTTMGKEDEAMKYLQENAQNNPAWSELSAIKNERFYMLPKDLFHYKPNNRWSESYEYIAKLIWPEIFDK